MTDYIDKPFQPGMTSDTYTPDQLIAGNLKLVTDTAVITGGAFLRGTVLGQVSVAGATAAPKAGGNTGNGTFTLNGSTPELANVAPGVYTLRCIEAAANGGTFRLSDPRGDVLGDFALPGTAGGNVAVAERIDGVLTDGSTDFAVGDGFDVTVATATGSYTIAKAGAVDGSAEPAAILVDFVDASQSDQRGGIYEMGEFNANAVILDPSMSLAVAKSALQRRGIFLRTSVSAADPIIPN